MQYTPISCWSSSLLHVFSATAKALLKLLDISQLLILLLIAFFSSCIKCFSPSAVKMVSVN